MVAGLVDHQIPTTRSDADRGLIADSHVVGFEQREDGMSLVKNQDTRDILEREVHDNGEQRSFAPCLGTYSCMSAPSWYPDYD